MKIAQIGILILILIFSINLVSAEENFTQLQSDVNTAINNNGILELNDNYTWQSTEITTGIMIKGNLTINGNGHTIDGKSSARIFNIESSYRVTINNINLINGKVNNGAAIYNSGGIVTISNVNFTNNTATDNGGAIYNTGTNFTVNNSNFNNNRAQRNSNNYGGGAIYNAGTNFSVNNSNFTNNLGTAFGGAIYNTQDNFIVNNSYFFSNAANSRSYGGGAIYNSGNKFTVIKSTFISNTANNGGAIYNTKDYFTVNNSNFTSNNVGSSGGAIYNSFGLKFTINNCNFTKNNANGTSSGGAIFNTGSNFTINKSNFTANTGKSTGGAIHNYFNSINFNINNSKFTNNSAINGGVIHNSGASFTIANSNFTNNTAKSGGHGGGVIYNIAINFNIVNSIFTNNTSKSAVYGGGVIYNTNGGSGFTISNSNFTSNNVITDGGVIHNAGSNFNISNSYFTSNTGKRGGVIYNIGSNFNVNNSTFTNNSGINGSAIYNTGSVFTANSNNFNNENNSAIFNSGASASCNVLNNIFNTAIGGYFVYNDRGTLFLKNNTMDNDIGFERIFNNAKITSSITLTILNNDTLIGNYGEIFTLNAILSDDKGNNIVGQNVRLTNSILKTFTLSNYTNGIYTYKTQIYKIGTFIFTGSYNGGTNLTIKTGKIIINPANTILNLTVNNETYDNDVIVFINLTDVNNTKFNTTVNITLNKKDYYIVNIVNGQGNYTFKGLSPGDYTVTVNLIDNTNFTSNSASANFTVYKFTPILDIVISNTVYGENTIIYANLSGIDGIGLNDTITITINKTQYTITTINGIGNITAGKLPANNYTATILYDGNQNYTNITFNTQFTVHKINSRVNVNVEDIIYGENATVQVKFNVSNLTGNITIFINGKEYNTVDVNKLPYILSGLNSGDYNLTVKYNGDENHSKSSNSTSFVVIKADVILNASNIIMYYKNGTKYIVKLKDQHGNLLVNYTINIVVNGVTYNKITNESGETSLNINLNPNNYTISSYFNGTENYNNASITTNLTVLSTIIGDDLVKFYRNGSQYYVKAVDKQGNPLNGTISFNINGVFYNKPTNKYGIAILTINLYPGDYVITATNVDGLSISNNITVKTTLIGYDLNKTFTENKTYDVKVLDEHGQPLAGQTVEINIHGRIYNKISGSDGIARLNINLDPGSYIATATWNSYSTSNIIKVE
ncbi:Ig-like domain repeat protein [Methanobrevibacter sp. OttesenSCG-928-K11]|nr:Ig-like domain repeat protein [Methanobrevibacter sp. OttesenSCG-928-K11]